LIDFQLIIIFNTWLALDAYSITSHITSTAEIVSARSAQSNLAALQDSSPASITAQCA